MYDTETECRLAQNEPELSTQTNLRFWFQLLLEKTSVEYHCTHQPYRISSEKKKHIRAGRKINRKT